MNKYYRIDHRGLFLLGYVFYFFTPCLVGLTNMFQGFPGIELYQGFFKLIPKEKLVSYMLITLSWLPAFFLGHFCFSLFKPYKRKLQFFPATATTRATSYVALFLLGILLVFAWLARNSLFAAYESYDIAARGKISSLLVVFNFFFLYQLISTQKLTYLLIIGIGITSFLLLTMGGRMYVMQTMIIYLVYKTSFATRRWKGYQIGVAALAGFLILSFVGVWRMGAGFSFDWASYSLMAEPVFTWFSTSSFLGSNEIPVINFPSNFLTSFFNLIPNSIVGLRPYVVSTQQMGYITANPLGAESVWSNIVINFGSVGSFFFIFLTGFILNFLRHLSESSRFGAVYYILVCGMLPFQFFRDGFFLMNKQLFFNFLFLPALILIILKTIIFLQTAYGGREVLMKAGISNNGAE